MDDVENMYENEVWAGMKDIYPCCEPEQASINQQELRAQIVAHLLPYYKGDDMAGLLIAAKNLETYIVNGIEHVS